MVMNPIDARPVVVVIIVVVFVQANVLTFQTGCGRRQLWIPRDKLVAKGRLEDSESGVLSPFSCAARHVVNLPYYFSANQSESAAAPRSVSASIRRYSLHIEPTGGVQIHYDLYVRRCHHSGASLAQ